MSEKLILRGPVIDVLRFLKPLLERQRRIRRASALAPLENGMAALASALHPVRQELTVRKIRRDSPDTVTYIVSPADSKSHIAPFQAGQYLSLNILIDGNTVVTRPYSISNTPFEARRDNEYHLTIKAEDSGVATAAIGRDWLPGKTISASEPCGLFTYESLRDPEQLIFIAGGSGVTPFRSLIGDLLPEGHQLRITLFQGAKNPEDVLFDSDFTAWEAEFPKRFHRVVVLSGGSSPRFIDAELIACHMSEPDKTAVFICGPEAMHRYLDEQLLALPVKAARIRREDYGTPGSFSGQAPYNITVEIAGVTHVVPSDPGETVLVALERAGLNPPSRCRTGSCDWCRGILLDGIVRYESEPEGLRRGDRKYGGFHPCAAFPASNLSMTIPGNPAFDSKQR